MREARGHMPRGRLPLAVLALVLGGCGAHTPTQPSRDPATPSTPPVLTILSGETGQPVSGASVAIAGRTYETNPSGQVTLAQGVDPNTPLDIRAPDFFDRETLLRSPAESSFTLWPRRSPSGLDESYTERLVYTSSTEPFERVQLRRLPPTAAEVVLVLAPEIHDHPSRLATHRDAAQRMTSVTGGRIVYTVASQRPGIAATVFDVRINHIGCSAGFGAFTQLSTRNDEILGGLIVYCNPELARFASTVTHELGHTFGLRHSPDPREVMFVGGDAARPPEFSPRELLAMGLTQQRRAGNRFPDNDRDAVTTLAALQSTVVCATR